MSICPVTQHQCRCQPDEGIPCPYEAKMTKDVVRDGLEAAEQALADWVLTYASEFCSSDEVDQAHARISERGTLGYIAEASRKVRLALESLPSEPKADQWTPEEIARHTAHSPKPMVLPTIPTVASRGLAFDGIRWNVGHHLTCAAVQGTSDQCDCGAAEKSSEPRDDQLIERIRQQIRDEETVVAKQKEAGYGDYISLSMRLLTLLNDCLEKIERPAVK